MTRMMQAAATSLIAGAMALGGCQQAHRGHGGAKLAKEHGQAWAGVTKAVAVLHGTKGNERVSGVVRFEQADGKVKVVADVSGLQPNQQHAIHVHEFGDCTAMDAMSAGSHYNPENHPHGLPNGGPRHAGDFGNLQADGSGKAHLELTVDNITVAGMRNPVIGRAVIVHAKPDDGSQPVGNAGGRIAFGVIGIAKP